MSNRYQRRLEVGSFTSDRVYIVAQRTDDGGWECSCPAWTMHTPRRDCKHIKATLAAMGQNIAAPVFATIPAVPQKVQPVAVPPAPEVVFGGYRIRQRRDSINGEGEGNGAGAAAAKSNPALRKRRTL